MPSPRHGNASRNASRTRRELAARLGVHPEKLVLKRDVVFAALAAGKRVCEIVRETGFAKGTVCGYACKFRQERLSAGGAAASTASRRPAPGPAAPTPA